MRVWIICLLLAPTTLLGGAKRDFIEAAKNQCKISEDEAKKLATKGRTGNVYKFKLCLNNPLKIKDQCKVECENKGAKIGK